MFDQARDQFLVFGGELPDGSLSNELWRFHWVMSGDGVSEIPTWERVDASGGIPGREGFGMVVDAAHARLVVIAGRGTSGLLGDVWTLDLTNPTPTWQASTLVSNKVMCPRQDLTAVWDPGNGQAIVYAGAVAGGAETYDTWLLAPTDGTWATVNLARPTPSSCFYGETCFYPPPGQNGNPCVLTNCYPSPRTGHMAVYDPVQARMFIISGNYASVDGPDYIGVETWAAPRAANFGAGANDWIRWGNSPPREYSSAVLDPTLTDGTIYIYGGVDDQHSPVSSTYSLDLSPNPLTNAVNCGTDPAPGSGVWLPLTTTGEIAPSRIEHAAAFDPVRHRMVVFGGSATESGAPLADLYYLGFNQATAGSPSAPFLEADGGLRDVLLYWYAPNYFLGNLPVEYDLRYSLSPIDSLNFAAATQVSGEPSIGGAGSVRSMDVTGLARCRAYYFGLKVRYLNGTYSPLETTTATTICTPGGHAQAAPLAASLVGPWPQPAADHVSLQLAGGSEVAPMPYTIDLYTITGRLVRHLDSGSLPGESIRLVWNRKDDSGREVPPGIYLVRARIGDQTFERKVIMSR